jgi:hypothetical protein
VPGADDHPRGKSGVQKRSGCRSRFSATHRPEGNGYLLLALRSLSVATLAMNAQYVV